MMEETMDKVFFWILIFFCFYAYFGYPLLLLVVSIFRQREIKKEDGFSPTITVIVAAHNEENIIKQKLDNLKEQDYENQKIEIIIASDGSSDSTEEIVSRYSDNDGRVKLFALPRLGKANALNMAAEAAKGDVLIFSDANAMLDPDAIRHLAGNFSDPEIGGVAGNQRYSRSDKTGGASLGEVFYWKYDRWLKNLETRVGNAISADGALYAIRRELFIPIKDSAATDDFSISTRVVTQGYRLIYDPEAVVVEATAGSSTREFKRKARIINRGLRSLFGLGQFLYPWHGGFYSVQLLSHKLLRRMVPLALPFLFLVNIVLVSEHIFYFAIFSGQLIVYGLGLIGFIFRNSTWGKNRLFYIPYYFCQANVAGLLGIFWFLKGQRIAIWQPQREET